MKTNGTLENKTACAVLTWKSKSHVDAQVQNICRIYEVKSNMMFPWKNEVQQSEQAVGDCARLFQARRTQLLGLINEIRIPVVIINISIAKEWFALNFHGSECLSI